MAKVDQIKAAYKCGFIDAVWYGVPQHRKRARKPSVNTAYFEGFHSGQHHASLADQRADAYAAQVCHVAPKEKSNA